MSDATSAEVAYDQITIVIVTYNSAHILPSVLSGLEKSFRVVVVDNGSRDDTVSAAEARIGPGQVIALGQNLGFGRANNAALERLDTPFALLLNPDCVISVEAVEALLLAAERYPDAAIFAPRLYDAPGRLGLCYRPPFNAPQPDDLIDPQGDVCSEFLTGAAMLLRMDVFRQIGFFDPWFFLYLEDDDLCMRARAAGHPLILVHDACAEHRVKQSSKPSARLDYRRAYCATASKLYLYSKHVGTAAYRRARWRSLSGAPFALLAAVITFNRRRTMRSLGRLLAAWRAPRLLASAHCIDALD